MTDPEKITYDGYKTCLPGRADETGRRAGEAREKGSPVQDGGEGKGQGNRDEVTEITASNYDEDKEEETVFSEDDLKGLYSQLDEVLQDIS